MISGELPSVLPELWAAAAAMAEAIPQLIEADNGKQPIHDMGA